MNNKNNIITLNEFLIVNGKPMPKPPTFLLTDDPNIAPGTPAYPNQMPDRANREIEGEFTVKTPMPDGIAKLRLVNYQAIYNVRPGVEHVIQFWSVQERNAENQRIHSIDFSDHTQAREEFDQRLALMKMFGESRNREGATTIEPARLAAAVKKGTRIDGQLLLPAGQLEFNSNDIAALTGKSRRTVQRMAEGILAHQNRYKFNRKDAGRLVEYILKFCNFPASKK